MTKRITAVILAFVLITGISIFANPRNANAVQQQSTSIRFVVGNPMFTVNGVQQQSVDGVPPFIDPATDRTMIPLRTLANAMGAQTGWDDNTRIATVFLQGRQVSVPLDVALPEGMGVPMVVNDRTFVPIRFVTETLGANIHWDPVARAVYVAHVPGLGPGQGHVPIAPPGALPIETSSPFEARVLELTNHHRVQHGLQPVIWNESLAQEARVHSRDMATNNFYAHQGSDGLSPMQRIQYHVPNMQFVAENIFAGSDSADRAMEVWMASPDHRDNILNPHATHVGVGFDHAPGSQFVFYVTQKFGREGAPAPTPTPAPEATPTPTVTPTPSPGNFNTVTSFEDEVRRLLNEMRRDDNRNRSNLTHSTAVRNYARNRSRDMERRRDSYSPLSQSNMRSRLRTYTYEFENGRLHENVYRGRNITPREVADAMWASRTTRDYLTDPRITHIAVGADFSGTGSDRMIYVTVVLGERDPANDRTVTVQGSRLDSGTGSNRSGQGNYTPGTRVDIRAGDDISHTSGQANGRYFAHWSVTQGGASLNNSNNRNTHFTMPSNNVTVRAYWRTTPGALATSGW